MCKRTFVLMTLVFVLGLVGSGSATTFYCDPVSGSMSNDGSSGSPWSTLQAVFDNNKIESRDKDLNTINSGAPVEAGDTIKLRSGSHGTIDEQGGYHNTSTITVEAQSGHTPVLTRLRLDYASNWIFRGIDIAYGMGGGANFIVDIMSGTSGITTHDITIDDCYIYSQEDSSSWTTTEWNNVPSGVRLRGSGNVVLQHSTIKNINKGIHVNSNCKVIGCSIQNFAQDGIRGSGSDITLEDNEILDSYNVNDNHDDGIQWYSGAGASSSNVVIRGTLVMNDTSGGTRSYISLLQGICNFNDQLSNWTVENNVVICGHYHGITLNDATNCTCANNTAYNPGYIAEENDRKTWIHFAGDSSNNTLSNNLRHSDTSGSNMQVTRSNYTQFFVSTNPSNLDLHLKAGSPAIDAGTSSGAPSVDFDGVSRPQGSGYDVGAYEYVSGANDTTAPSPDPMTWSTDPYATGDTSISMTATTATDVSGVEYYFDCITSGGHDSGWQDSTTYEDTGLTASTQYTYQVKARDKSSNQNETAYSTTKSATTNAADTTAPSPDPMTWATEPNATGTSSISMTATTATDTSGVEYYFDCTAGGGSDSGWQDSTTYGDAGLDPNTQYSYKVKARDKSSNQNETAFSTVKSTTTNAESGDPNLEAWWKFDETSGTSASDSSGNDHTGTLENGASFTSGYINNAVNFDGSDDRVSCGTWNVTGSAITICCWFKADTFTGSYYDGRLVSKTTSTSEQDHTWMLSGIKEGTSNKRLRFRLKTGGTTSTLIASSGNMTTGTWYHGAAVYNGSTMKLYLDANEVGSTSKSGSITTSSAGIAIGQNPSGAGTVPWDGLIDDVRIYDRALSESELEELVSGEDTTAPSPDPMTWATDPYATGTTSISMTATTATDTSGVEYYFDETSGNPGGSDSGWQDSATYEDTGLSATTQYSYQVKARDKSSNQNETTYSTLKSATTDATPDTTPPSPDPMTWATDPYATGATSISMTATTATDASGVEYYFDCTAGGGNDSGWQDSTTYEDTGLSELTEYTYRVKARDKSSNLNETAYSTTKSATTQDGTAPSPDPMTWATEPYATGATSISMTATTATDASGVEYYFECTAGGGSDSGWQDSTTYADTGLSELTEYTYRVKARDKSSNQNETGYSTTKSATTEDGTAPSPDPMTWATDPYSTGTTSISMTATTATDTSGVEYYFDCTAGGGNDSGWQDSTTYEDTGLSPETQYTYKVQSRDKSSNQNAAGWSTEKSATTDAVSGEPNLVSWWKLDESSGTGADDSSGNNHDGTLSGGSWAPTSGKFDGAVDLGDATSDRVQVPTTGMSASVGTVSVWGRLEGTQSASRYFFGHTSGSGPSGWADRMQLYMDNDDNQLDLGLGDSHTTATSIMTLSANTWYHIALTWDGGDYVVYVDGIEKASGTYTGLSTLGSVADIGNNGNTTYRVEAFQGLLDDVRIYDGVLSKYDIAELAGITIASSPNPADEATGVSTTADLSWSAGYYTADVNGHDVYLGTDYNSVADANHSSAEFKGTQSSATYDPGAMSNNTTYYWAIDEVNDTNTWAGDVFSFTTGLDPNLVSWWKLDESSGTNADDSSGNNHDGTLSGGSWAPTSGKYDGAVNLGDANSDHVEIPTTGMSASAGTVCLWGRIEGTQSAGRYLFGHTSSPSSWADRIQLYMNNGDNQLDLGLGDTHSKQTNIQTLSASTWYHIALTWDGSNYVVYVDGVSKANGTYTGLSALGSYADVGNSGGDTAPGARIESFQGLLDQVRVYNKELSQSEVEALAGE